MGIELFNKLQPFAIALAIGMLIGIERERSHPPGFQALGLRTFVLLSILGAMAARFDDPWIAVSLTTFVGAAVIVGYLRSSRRQAKKPDIGITTEIAGVVTYALGFLAAKEPFVSLLLAVVVLVVLMARSRLHRFSRDLLPLELRAAATILILALGILPFLPDKTIDPWQLFNPLRFGTLVVIIALLQFTAYAGIRIFGATKGILLSGFLAGFVSSTAATATLSERSKKGTLPTLAVSTAVILATIAMLTELIIIIFVIDSRLLYTASVPIVMTCIVSGLFGFGIAKYYQSDNHYPIPSNPLALTSAIKLAMFLFLMLMLVTLSERLFGHLGARLVIFLGGLVEIHGVVLAIVTLFHQGKMTAIEATTNIGFAVTASFISKYIIIWVVARNRFALITSLLLSIMLAIFIVAWLFVIH